MPLETHVKISVKDSADPTFYQESSFNCTLQGWDAVNDQWDPAGLGDLTWDHQANRPERRQYDCTQL